MKGLAYLILLSFLLRPLLPVVDYCVNYEYISGVLCENKSKPKMHCNGKCHLMKELAKTTSDGIPSVPNKIVANPETDLLFVGEMKTLFLSKTLFSKDINAAYTNLYSHTWAQFVFRPPLVSSSPLT